MTRAAGRPAAAGFALAAAALAAPARARAQQYITDDAEVTEARACQIQMWHGERASWVLPVCAPAHNLELSLGFIAVWRDGAGGHFEYAAQAKTLFRALRPDGWGAGLVAGTGRDPALATTADKTSTVFAYVPVSRAFAGTRLVVHQNAGWLYQRQGGGGGHALTWAARADYRAARRLALVAEVYGTEAVGRGGSTAPAEFQAGARSWLRPDVVQVDLSYGGRLRDGRVAAGWTLGLALVTPPFL